MEVPRSNHRQSLANEALFLDGHSMLCPYKRVKAIPVKANRIKTIGVKAIGVRTIELETIGVNTIGFYVAGAARLRQNQ